MKQNAHIALFGLLLSSLAGCESPVVLTPSEARADLLPEASIAHRVSSGDPRKYDGLETWSLYRDVYCAEKAGAPFLVGAYLRSAGETRQSWEGRLDQLVQDIREGREGAAHQWQRIADTPCEQD